MNPFVGLYSRMCSNVHTRELNHLKVVQSLGHNFLGSRSYDLGIWQDFSTMSPLPSYTY